MYLLLSFLCRIAHNFLDKMMKKSGKTQNSGAPGEARKNGREALVILVSLSFVGKIVNTVIFFIC